MFPFWNNLYMDKIQPLPYHSQSVIGSRLKNIDRCRYRDQSLFIGHSDLENEYFTPPILELF